MTENLISKLVNVKLAIARKNSKYEVEKKYMDYLTEYNEKSGEKTIGDKIRHHELYFKYLEYMERK